MEAASSGNLDQALGAVPPQAHETLSDAAREGFLTGLNDVLVLAALIAFIGAALALWLVREREIERQPLETDVVSEPALDITGRAPVVGRTHRVTQTTTRMRR
jgi:hypothetical protein